MADHLTFDMGERPVTFEVNEEARTIKGLVLPYGVVGDNGRGKYTFAKGTVSWPADLSRVKLLVNHDFGQAVGHATDLTETDEGVVGTFKVARGADGDKALSMAADKVWDGLSAGISNDAKFANKNGVLHSVASPIAETSLTPMPAFTDARVRAVAASAAPSGKEPVMGDENDPKDEAPATFSLSDGQALQASVQALTEELAELKKIKIPVGPGGQQFQVQEEPMYRFGGTEPAPSGFDFATDLLHAAKDGDAAALDRIKKFTAANLGPQFAPDGVTKTTDVTSINQPTYRPDMFIGQAPTPASPLYDFFYKGGLSNVTPFFWSKLDRTNTTVGVHDHTEGVDPDADDIATVSGATVTPVPVSGKVHITREVSDQGGNPQVSGLVWSEFQRSFSIALETKTAALISAAMSSITALATIASGTSGPDAGLAVESGLVDLQFLPDGFRFTRSFGHVDLYKALVTAANSDGEKIYPILAPTNRDGTTADKFASLQIAGYSMYPAASLGASSDTANNSLVADPNAVQVWNSGLQRLDKLQETVEGWDLGCFAYFAGIVYDITGLRKITYTKASE
jgi:HK97 family phage prohead protease